MADSWEDLVTPVSRGQNAMAADGVSPYENAMAQARTMVRAPSPLGYEYSRAQFDRRVNEGLSGRDALEALTLGLTALAPGRPRPNPVGPPAAEVFDMPGMRNASRVNAIEDTNPAGWPRSLHYPANAQHAPKLDVIPGGKTKGGPAPGGMTFDDVRGMLDRLGIPIDRVATAGTGTRYVQVRDNNGAVVTIRVPGDTHAGNPQKAGQPGEFFDTASQRLSPSQERYRSGTVVNEGGERFANPEALEAALRWRFPNYVSRTGENFLVRPDQAPRTRPNTETPAPAREGADFSPDQPRLLSVAAPAAAGWAATVTPEPSEMAPRENEAQSNAGRFAAPLVSPDVQLVTDTRLLNDRVSAATRNIEADFDFSDLVTPVTPHARRGMREALNAMAGS